MRALQPFLLLVFVLAACGTTSRGDGGSGGEAPGDTGGGGGGAPEADAGSPADAGGGQPPDEDASTAGEDSGPPVEDAGGGGAEDAAAPVEDAGGGGRPDVGPIESTNYLIVATDDLAEVADDYAAYRTETGYLTDVVALSDLDVNTRSGLQVSVAVRQRLVAARDALPQGAVLYLLLLGDAPSARESARGLIPALECDNLDGDCWTDNTYGDLDGDGVPEVAVGRIPVREPAAATAYLDKLKARDAHYEVGLWNRRVVLYTGTPGFGEQVDAILEGLVLEGLKGMNAAFDLVGVYASPSSPYYYEPLEDKVIELINGGSLMSIYIGHGSAEWSEGLPMERLDEIGIEHRLPFMFFFACSNGDYVGRQDSLAEALLRIPDGPITTFASSDISHPYGNSILPYELQRIVFDERPATIGEATLLTKQYSISHSDRFREVIDLGAIGQGIDEREAEVRRFEHLNLYNLFGDPAAPMLYPAADTVMVPGVTGRLREDRVTVGGEAPGIEDGKAWVTLEGARDLILHDLEQVDPDRPNAAAARRNWEKATDKVVASAEVPVTDGRFEAELTFEEGIRLPQGGYYVKVYADDGTHDAFGSAPAQR